jgi:hypothetical protein
MPHHPVFALFSRAMSVEARSSRSYLVRLVWLTGTLLVLWGATQHTWRAAPGLEVFVSITVLNLVLICLVGTQLFANAITEEKEEQTLGLLRMTALSPVAILLGKSTGRMFTMGMLLLAQLPFTLLSITLGGISLGQISAVYAAILGLIILMANLALLWSVICRRGSSAMSLTVFSMLILFAVPAVIDSVGQSMRGPKERALGQAMQQAMEPVLAVSPFVRCADVLGGFDGQILHPQLFVNIVLGALFFGLAWCGFEFFTRAKPGTGESRGGVLISKSKEKTGHRRIFRVSRAWKFPLAWKTFFFESHGMLGWIVRIGIVLGLMVLADIDHSRDLGGFLVWMGIAGFLIESGLISSSLFRSEHAAQTWSSLYGLPLDVGGITIQKILGATIGMIPWLLAALCGAMLLKDGTIIDFLDEVFLEEPIGFYLMAMYAALLVLTVWISLWAKRGGFLLAFAILFGMNMLLSALIKDGDGVMGASAVIYVMTCTFGPIVIAQRLRDLAAAE